MRVLQKFPRSVWVGITVVLIVFLGALLNVYRSDVILTRRVTAVTPAFRKELLLIADSSHRQLVIPQSGHLYYTPAPTLEDQNELYARVLYEVNHVANTASPIIRVNYVTMQNEPSAGLNGMASVQFDYFPDVQKTLAVWVSLPSPRFKRKIGPSTY